MLLGFSTDSLLYYTNDFLVFQLFFTHHLINVSIFVKPPSRTAKLSFVFTVHPVFALHIKAKYLSIVKLTIAKDAKLA
jgi:hypothetical protein